MKIIKHELSDAMMDARGSMLVEVFNLKEDKGYTPRRFHTSWGNKTFRGLYLTALRIVKEGK